MKICTITFHFASNQGAVLQAYALQKYLSKCGHNVEIIDYQPGYHTVRYMTKKNPFLYAWGYWKKFHYMRLPHRLKLTLRSFARSVYMNTKHTDEQVQIRFEEFRKAHLHLTKKYSSFNQLLSDPPRADAYISGSDQLWNPEVLDQSFDKAYFLRFGDKDVLRITYAVSIGKEMPTKYLGELHSLCEDLSAVSLREYNKDVVQATGRDVHICVDPTFLIDAVDYQEAEAQTDEREPYIFVYGFESNDSIFNAIRQAKEKYNCKIINGSPMRIKYQGQAHNIREYGPDMFLCLIKNAECVVTNSFHATTFSIIYNRPFITVAHSTRGLRMRNLLGQLELRSRLYGDRQYDIDSTIDYERVSEKLRMLRSHSQEYLAEALLGKKGEEIGHFEDERYSFVE